MVIFEINSVPYGSTGRIMFQLAKMAENHGHVAYTSASFTKSRGEVFPERYYRIGTVFGKFFHIQVAKRNGWHGLYSKIATRNLIKKLEKVNPDIIHLHNLHGWFLNYQMFTEYLKGCNKPIVWTLHDCWAVTGQCPHFLMEKCDKWKSECYECPIYMEYPGGRIDRSRELHQRKKEWFGNIPNMTIVTPSKWLRGVVRESYLKEYEVKVINNGIDLDVFKPTQSDFRRRHSIKEDQYVILGVAFEWGKRKGLDVFLEIAKRLGDKYCIVLVGTNEEIDKILPENIVSVHCTQSQTELAEIYASADVFVNPTREDTFPTVNIEALACGTPVITFETGGSPESIDENCGEIVPCDDICALEEKIRRVTEDRVYKAMECRKRAEMFEYKKKNNEYIRLFEDMIVH